jgi:multiple sugar transport system substrate-binding protein
MKMGKLSRRGFLRLAAGTTAAVALAGCQPATPQAGKETVTPGNPPAGEMLTLVFWNGIGPPEGILMQEFMNRWENTQPNVKLNQWTTDWDTFYTKLKLATAQQTLPDLAVIHPWRIAAYADVAFKPIDSMLAAQSALTADMFNDVPWKAMQFKGKQYGFPMDNFLFALYYNVTLLQNAGVTPPQSEADLVEFAKKFTQPPQKWGFTHPSGDGKASTWDFTAFLAHEGQKGYISEDGTKAAFNNAAGLKAAQRMYDDEYTDNITPDPSRGLDAYQLFLDGKVAFRLGGTWEKFAFDSVKNLTYQSIVFTPKEPGTFGGSHNFVFTMANGDQRTKAAWDAATWVVLNCDTEWGIRAGHIPALKKSATDQTYLDASVNMQGHRDSVPYMVGLPKVAKLDECEEALTNSLNEMFLNTKPPKQVLAEAETKVNAILAS